MNSITTQTKSLQEQLQERMTTVLKENFVQLIPEEQFAALTAGVLDEFLHGPRSMRCACCDRRGLARDFDSTRLTYTVDCDERGEFRASVDDWRGQTVYEIDAADGGLDDHGMRHKRDTGGLLEHLCQVGLAGADHRFVGSR